MLLRAGRWGFYGSIPGGGGAGNFSLHHRVKLTLGHTQPPIQWVPGAFSLRVERPEREADHSPLSSTEAKEWSYTSTPPVRLHGVVLS
jgi:hypothetical protein